MGKKVQTAEAPFDFEKAMRDLEGIVASMETKELTLETSLAHFEQGIQLVRHCQQALEQAEQKVQVLTSQSTGMSLESFDVKAT